MSGSIAMNEGVEGRPRVGVLAAIFFVPALCQ
jgi:hypothetical protein